MKDWSAPNWNAEQKDAEMDKGRFEVLKGAEAIQRGGGEDAHRLAIKTVIERKIMDHSMSGYNLQTKPVMDAERESWMRSQEGAAADRGTIMPDGLFRR